MSVCIVHACSCPEKYYVRQPARSEKLKRRYPWLPAYARQYHHHILTDFYKKLRKCMYLDMYVYCIYVYVYVNPCLLTDEDREI